MLKPMRYRVNKSKPAPIGGSCKKTSYHTRDDAEDMIRHIKETRITKEIKAYRCEICGFWHLTSREK